MTELRTFRGKGLEQVLPEIRAELGPQAVVVARREVLEGGVGGFFARRVVEVDALPPVGLDLHADEVAMPELLPPAPARADDEEAAPVAPDFGALLEQHTATAMAVPGGGDDDDLEPARTPPEPSVVGPPPDVADASDDLDLLVGVAATADDRRSRPSDLQELLRARGLSPHLARALREEAGGTPTVPGDPALLAALAGRIAVAPPRPGADGAAIAFVGSNGAGKTRSSAALATAFATRSALAVTVIALRPGDDGAEIARLLDGTDVDVHVAETDADVVALVQARRAGGLVVVDTPGVAPRDDVAREELRATLAGLDLDATYGCLPATAGAGSGSELAAALRALGATAVALTHADETSLPGAAIELAIDAGTPIALVGRSSSPRAGLRPAVAGELAEAALR